MIKKELMKLSLSEILLLFLIVILLTLFAYSNRFIQDDAFISFRYAENLITGKGLVFNEGENVEGYTNFLWTILIGLMHNVLNPIKTSYVFGLFFFIGTLCSTYFIAYFFSRKSNIALISVILLGTNYTFSAYATGGLETQLQAFLVTSSFLLALYISQEPSIKKIWIYSVLCSLALLTRLDSVLILFISFFVFSKPYFFHLKLPEKYYYIFALLLPFSIIVGSWLIWKNYFYGKLLPNTFYAKTGESNIELGVIYLYQFLKSYWLLFSHLPVMIFLFLKRQRSELYFLILIIVLWSLYLVKVGGDFMEFRFIVPILPVYFILISIIISQFRLKWISVAIVVLTLLGSLNHTFRFNSKYGIESIKDLKNHIYKADENWKGIGEALYRYFGEDASIKIGVCAAGAIPFYSKLNTIDMHGLNDSWIANNGLIDNIRPGHNKIAPFSYLIKTKVNLIIGHPRVIENSKTLVIDEELIESFIVSPLPKNKEKVLEVLAIPINNSYSVLALYSHKNKIIDTLIKDGVFTSYSVK